MNPYKTKKIPFTGACTALLTPMSGGRIERDAFRALVRWQVDMGIDALCVCGTTGEAATLTPAERRELLCLAKEEAGATPVLMGCGCSDTAQTCENCRAAAALGADALLVITPYCNKGTAEGLLEHFRRVSDAAGDTPVILYNIPSRTGVDLRPSQYIALAECPNICAVKEASPDLGKITRLCGDTPLAVYSGNDDMILPVVSLGGKGVISVLSNIAPAAVGAMTHAALESDFPTAARLAHKYAELIRLLFAETNPAPVKYAASLLELCTPEARLPIGTIGEDLQKAIAAEMTRLKML